MSDIITEEQRAEALENVAKFRALSSDFLDAAERIIKDGTANNNEQLFTACANSAAISVSLGVISRALWKLEDEAFRQMSVSWKESKS
jgi:hypothetical protein